MVQQQPSAVALSNAQKAKDFTTVGVVVAVSAAALAYGPSRAFLQAVHSGSTLGAVSLYVAVVALLYVCYSSLMKVSEWRGGGVSGILNSAEGDNFHKEQVSNLVDGYYGNFGEESRSVQHTRPQPSARELFPV